MSTWGPSHKPRLWQAWRRLACAWGLVAASSLGWAQSPGFVVSGDGVASAAAQGAPAQAVGLIVKLRDAGGAVRASVGSPAVPATAADAVVRLQASRLPADGAAAQQMRLSQALQRRGVRHLGHHATAFAARAAL